GVIRAIAQDEALLITYDADLNIVSSVSLPMALGSLDAFGVEGDVLAIYTGGATDRIRFYNVNTMELISTVDMMGSVAGVNSQILFGTNSIFVKSGTYLKRLEYTPSCFVIPPEGWYVMPDSPNAYTDGNAVVPKCGTVDVVTPGKVSLPAIVTDIASRVG